MEEIKGCGNCRYDGLPISDIKPTCFIAKNCRHCFCIDTMNGKLRYKNWRCKLIKEVNHDKNAYA
jgi:hypothetical protein